MNVAVGLVVGFLAARLTWVLLKPTLATSVFLRENYRHHRVPTAGGLVLAAAVVGVEALRCVLGALGVGEAAALSPVRLQIVCAVMGFTLLGLADDLGAVGTARGFRGHLISLRRGKLTTGGLKLFGGGALAVVLASTLGRLGGREPGGGAFVALAIDSLVIALGANLANLFDRAPGRVVKISTGCFVALIVGALLTQRSSEFERLTGIAVLIGAALGVLLDDLHERMMLGDTGANSLGAVLGAGVVLTCAPSTRTVLALVLIALNALSEVVSFSAVIDRVRPLRALDRAGTLAVRRGPSRS